MSNKLNKCHIVTARDGHFFANRVISMCAIRFPITMSHRQLSHASDVDLTHLTSAYDAVLYCIFQATCP